MVHKPFDRTIVCNPGVTMSKVGSSLLTRGNVGIYDLMDTDENGLKPVLSFAGRDKNEKRYVICTGNTDDVASRSNSNKSLKSQVFTINEIVGVYASYPKTDTMGIDDVIIGFNGNDESTGFTAKKGQRINVKLTLHSKALEMLGYDNGIELQDTIAFDECSFLPHQCEDCDPCEEPDCLQPVLNMIERYKNQPVAAGHIVDEFLEITPVHKCATAGAAPATTDMNFFCMSVCDTGDDRALGLVASQYPGKKVVRTDRKDSTSYYKVITEDATMPDYKMTFSSVMKGCGDCPDGYTAKEGGLIYSILLEDEGEDKKADVEALANAVAGTAVKQDGNYFGVGLYTAQLSKKPTDAEMKTFTDANPSATIKYVITTADMCENPTVENVKWSKCGSCKVSTEKYYITVPDKVCGDTNESRLKEVQAAYPDLTIKDYAAGSTDGCMHSFETEVKTNMVCEECDDVFKNYFKSDAPAPYDGHEWVKVPAATSDSGCICGIRFRSKVLEIIPSDRMEDKMSYVEDATRIAVEGGWLDELVENDLAFQDPLAVTWISRWSPVTHRGADLKDAEREGLTYFRQKPVHDRYMEREWTNEQTLLDNKTQYADIAVTLLTVRDSNGVADRVAAHTTIHFFVEYGAHQGIVDMVNMMAAAAGISGIK